MLDIDLLACEVPTLLKRVAEAELLPRLAAAADTARLKAAGEVITDADLGAEAAITEGLRALTPDAMIVGEEGAHSDPTLLDGLADHDFAWLVDPLDGSRHFAEGGGPFGIMLTLLREGRSEAAWIHLPLSGDTCFARRGGGAVLNGERVYVPEAPKSATLRGGLLTRFFPEPLKSHAEACDEFERTDGAHHCAAQRYVDLVRGEEHFAAYWRTLPWDHASGALIVAEAGGVVRRFDASPFDATDAEATSLLVACDEPTWRRVRTRALGIS